MAQIEPQALPSKLFMSPFDQQMVEDEDIKPVSLARIQIGRGLIGAGPSFLGLVPFHPRPKIHTL